MFTLMLKLVKNSFIVSSKLSYSCGLLHFSILHKTIHVTKISGAQEFSTKRWDIFQIDPVFKKHSIDTENEGK